MSAKTVPPDKSPPCIQPDHPPLVVKSRTAEQRHYGCTIENCQVLLIEDLPNPNDPPKDEPSEHTFEI